MSPPAVPLIVVGPVFVIVVAPNTANVVVLPGVTVGPAAETIAGIEKIAISGRVTKVENIFTLLAFLMVFRFCYVFICSPSRLDVSHS